jgi:hypothetical protein
MRLQAQSGTKRKGKSVILLWLDGGPPHMDTYDPKPLAPSEYRGPWGALKTNAPGVTVSESLPLHAKHGDKMVLLRSVHHNNGDHFAAAHWMLTGRHGSSASSKAQQYPSAGSYVSRVKGANAPGMPAYVGLPSAESVALYPGYMGAAYLGTPYAPYDVNIKQRRMGYSRKEPFNKPEFLNSGTASVKRTGDRVDLLKQLDHINRAIDKSGQMAAMDKFNRAAVNMLLSPAARAAFDIEKEDAKTRDRYGRNAWGHYTLMARRLVEAGVSFASVDIPSWDWHSKIKDGMGKQMPYLDKVVDALLTDLKDRGLLDDVLVMVMGEFGRTPKMNGNAGRDHWGNVMSVMLAGGGLKTGQVIGASNSKGEHPVERPLKPGDVLATVYELLGIDPSQTFLNHSGRPIPILHEGKPILEIL